MAHGCHSQSGVGVARHGGRDSRSHHPLTRSKLVTQLETLTYYKEATLDTKACMDKIDEVVNHEQERGTIKDGAFDW